MATYADLLARLESVRALGVELGLERVRRALAALGEPQRRLLAVQLAGTNGKGSTSAMTESILRAAGVRTGLYTSPHLSRFTERIRVAGREADGDRLAALDARIVATGVPLTYFEVATVLAFLSLAEERVEVAVLETGLGGRLDAVTTCEPVATAITSIALDHRDYLGDTLREIAGEKAGILKAGVPCFVGALPPEADEEIARVAAAVSAPLSRFGRELFAPEVPIALPGDHQRANAALAVALATRA
ncbi:MAG: tetrahydrofolylpolyglutamate synthase, partial [Myxococcales bacterium]|nr:tetrahydrofolylpolyglutamate synthase [Myxococcales bacterium]